MPAEEWIPVSLDGKWYYVLYPRPAYIITTGNKAKYTAMAASWVMPVSMHPPLVAVSVAPKRYTYELLREAGEFAVNIMDYKYYKEVSYVGTVSGREEEDKLAKAGLTKMDAKRIDCPVVAEATAILECRVVSEVGTGDHVLFIGEVLEAYAKEPLAGKPDIKNYKALLQVAGLSYTTTVDEVVKC